jgi:hypothetical protein
MCLSKHAGNWLLLNGPSCHYFSAAHLDFQLRRNCLQAKCERQAPWPSSNNCHIHVFSMPCRSYSV